MIDREKGQSNGVPDVRNTSAVANKARSNRSADHPEVRRGPPGRGTIGQVSAEMAPEDLAGGD